MKKLAIISLALLFLAPGTSWAEEPDTIIFPHDIHHEEELECANCHEGVAESADPLAGFLPDMDVCGDCHDVDDDETCHMCHTNVDNAGEYHRPAYRALFPHAPHTLNETTCADCHGEPTLPNPVQPAKADCRGCHQTTEIFSDCRQCHEASFELLPADHGSSWLHEHGGLARVDQPDCYQCHTETGCQECHSGDNVRPRSHDFNYAFNHALDARSGQTDCTTCHLEPEYCSACHVSNRIMPTDHSLAGWTSLSGGGRHATEGLFDLESCVACHDAGAQDPSCTECHGR